MTDKEIFGGFTLEEMKELHSRVVSCHISKALTRERMSAADRYDDLELIHRDIVQAAWFIKSAIEHTQNDMEIKGRLCRESNRLHDDLKAANQRIAELESRTLNTIEPFRSFVTDADLAALHRFVECCDDPESGGHDLNKEKTRRLEEIGALRRSGRISYLTDFGDLLVSITTGIDREVEL